MAGGSYQENYDVLVRCLLGDGAVRIGDLGGVFPHPDVFHVGVLDVAQARDSSVDDLSKEEGKCREKSIAKGEDKSDERLRAGAREKQSGETKVVTNDSRHRNYDI